MLLTPLVGRPQTDSNRPLTLPPVQLLVATPSCRSSYGTTAHKRAPISTRRC